MMYHLNKDKFVFFKTKRYYGEEQYNESRGYFSNATLWGILNQSHEWLGYSKDT